MGLRSLRSSPWSPVVSSGLRGLPQSPVVGLWGSVDLCGLSWSPEVLKSLWMRLVSGSAWSQSISVFSGSLHWSLWSPSNFLVSGGLQWSSWSPSVSGGLWWSPWVSVVSGGLRWSPMFSVVSVGLQGSVDLLGLP